MQNDHRSQSSNMRGGHRKLWNSGGGRDTFQSQRQNRSKGESMIETGKSGNLVCNHDLGTYLCLWRTNSEISLKLHRADRHLILPEGGSQELEKIDPILQEEKREKARRVRKRTADDTAEDQANLLIPGLNIQLDTPELIQKWLDERKKRWPTASVIQQKELQSWDERPPVRHFAKRPVASKAVASEEESSSSDSSSEDEDDEESAEVNAVQHHDDKSDSDSESSGSDLDPEKDAISSKMPPLDSRHSKEEDRNRSPLCRFFQNGKCRNGDKCTHRHELGNITTTSQNNQKKRKRPKAPSPNPFEAPHLLRALLRNEIAQHISSVAQVVRFLVRNDYLENYEYHSGDAKEQSRRRGLIKDVEDVGEKETRVTEDRVSNHITEGALPIANGALYSPPSPELKPLEHLSLPPEPDEFALMDPLRAHDAKPLTHEQFRQIAQDVGIRALLLEDDGIVQKVAKANPKLSKGMVRALSTLDALPSFNHRASALELILGVSEQSALHSHQVGPTYVRSDRKAANPGSGQSGSSGKDGPSRVIGETELFRLGLRVGPIEIQRIRQFASRVSNLIGGPAFELDQEGDQANAEQFRPWLDEKTRHEMRVKQWHKEGEWRDEMRRLGVEID